MFSDQTGAHQYQHQQQHHHQQLQQHQQHQHYQHQHHQQQHQHYPGKASDREDLEEPEGRRDYYCYLGDLGKSTQHTFKQGGVERALEFGEPATAVAASDLGGVRDEWLSAMDDSTAMLFDDATSTTTIRLELVGACCAAAAAESASAATALPSPSSLSSSLSPPSSSSLSLPSPSFSSLSSSVGPVSATATATTTTAEVTAAAARAAIATAPDQTRDFFWASVTGHGGDFSAADWLADVGVDTVGGGGGDGGACFGGDGGVGVSMGVAFGLGGGGCASEPSSMSIGDEMLPPEARPPWEKATTARSRLVACESVLPLPKPLPKPRQASKAFAARRRFPTPEIDPANVCETSTGRLRRGASLPR